MGIIVVSPRPLFRLQDRTLQPFHSCLEPRDVHVIPEGLLHFLKQPIKPVSGLPAGMLRRYRP